MNRVDPPFVKTCSLISREGLESKYKTLSTRNRFEVPQFVL